MTTRFVCDWCVAEFEDRAQVASVDATIGAVNEKLHMCVECAPSHLRQHYPDEQKKVADGGDGAVDHHYDEATRDSEMVLAENLADTAGDEHALLKPGDIAIDLVTRQPLYVADRVADTLPEYHADEGFDLLTYKQHAYLPVRMDDPVFECVFVGGLDDLHSFSDTYSYPAGRLARVPVELAGDSE